MPEYLPFPSRSLTELRGNRESNQTSVPLFVTASRQSGQTGRLSRLRSIKLDKRDAFLECGASSQRSGSLFRIAGRYVEGSGPLLRNAARQMGKAERLSELRRIKWEKRHVCHDCGDVRSRSRLFGCVCRLTWFSWPHFPEKSGIDI